MEGGTRVGVGVIVGGINVAVGAAVGVQVCVAAAVNVGVAEISGALTPHESSEIITRIIKSENANRGPPLFFPLVYFVFKKNLFINCPELAKYIRRQ